VDMNGNITGNFTPTFDVKAISVDDAEAFIDDFYAGVVSVNPAVAGFLFLGLCDAQVVPDKRPILGFGLKFLIAVYEHPPRSRP